MLIPEIILDCVLGMAAMEKIHKLLVLFCLLTPAIAVGQDIRQEEELIEQLKTERFSEAATGILHKPDARVLQTGNSNAASVTQRNSTSQSNGAFIMQVGDYNRAALHQQGHGNKTVATQIGTNNVYRGDIDGIDNSSHVLQKGSLNNISQTINGINLEHTLIQLGNNNTINQVETSPDSRSYKVIQQGNNMNIRIEQSNWGVPATAVKK